MFHVLSLGIDTKVNWADDLNYTKIVLVRTSRHSKQGTPLVLVTTMANQRARKATDKMTTGEEKEHRIRFIRSG